MHTLVPDGGAAVPEEALAINKAFDGFKIFPVRLATLQLLENLQMKCTAHAQCEKNMLVQCFRA